MQNIMKRSGHCLCGHITFSYASEESWSCYCHCNDCRRNCAAPVVAFIGVQLDQFEWGESQPKYYQSSPGVKRFFCDQCGTPMAFQANHYEGEIHLYVATLDDPQAFTPQFHVHYAKKLDWLCLQDELPKFPSSAPS